jgi:transposase InsO family protein
VDYFRYWTNRAETSECELRSWAEIPEATLRKWKKCYGKAYEHNGWIPRDNWLTDDEKQAIIKFHFDHPLEGYRRLTYMMIDADVVACSPCSVYRVLRDAGVLRTRRKLSQKGKGFQQPLTAHEHWHVDVAYINICGTFCFMATVVDGFSRTVVNWAIGEKMESADLQILLQQAAEKFPNATPRIISDNGPQFIANDFKAFVKISGMTHVRTSPFYPQSNGKIERYHRTVKSRCIRPATPLSIEDARRAVDRFVTHYNTRRLHSALGYVTPLDMLEGRQKSILDERDRKLEEARHLRAERRRQEKLAMPKKLPASPRVSDVDSPVRLEDRATLGSAPSA